MTHGGTHTYCERNEENSNKYLQLYFDFFFPFLVAELYFIEPKKYNNYFNKQVEIDVQPDQRKVYSQGNKQVEV